MFAVICWTSKNGVALEREELEVQSSSKYVVMNGGKQEAGAAVSMVFRKEIWGGIIQSIHDSKKDAEEGFKREISGVQDNVEEACQSEEDASKLGKRQRKRKNFGKEFELGESEEELDATDDKDKDGPTGSPVPKKSKTPDKKTEKKKKASSAKKTELLSITAQHDELVITKILSSSSTSLNPPVTVADSEENLDGCSTSEPAATMSQAEKKLQHPHFAGKQPKQHKPPKCISMICKEEKERLTEELMSTREELDNALEELRTLKTLQENTGSTATVAIEYGKVTRSVGIAKNWEEIGNGVWCCPIKVKAAVRDASSRTGLACALLAIFYPKEKLNGKRLQQLDQDIIEAITDFSMVAKITKEPKPRKLKNQDDNNKPPSPPSRSIIKQALRLKCNTLIHYESAKKKGTKGTAGKENKL